jgi:hypothetical protein
MIAWLKANQYLLRAWFWIIMAPVTILWLKDSILWIAMMSLYANVETALGAHEARRGRDENGD